MEASKGIIRSKGDLTNENFEETFRNLALFSGIFIVIYLEFGRGHSEKAKAN